MVEELNIQKFLNKKTGELSSGQKNRSFGKITYQ